MFSRFSVDAIIFIYYVTSFFFNQWEGMVKVNSTNNLK